MLVKLGFNLAKNWSIWFLAFLAISREKWVNFSRISREIQNARNVHVYSTPLIHYITHADHRRYRVYNCKIKSTILLLNVPVFFQTLDKWKKGFYSNIFDAHVEKIELFNLKELSQAAEFQLHHLSQLHLLKHHRKGIILFPFFAIKGIWVVVMGRL